MRFLRFLAVSIMGGALLGVLLDTLYVLGVWSMPPGTAICHLAIC